jgi:hypothetical protein
MNNTHLCSVIRVHEIDTPDRVYEAATDQTGGWKAPAVQISGPPLDITVSEEQTKTSYGTQPGPRPVQAGYSRRHTVDGISELRETLDVFRRHGKTGERRYVITSTGFPTDL